MTRREIIERAAGILAAVGVGAAVEAAPPALKVTTPTLPTGDVGELTSEAAAGTWTDTKAPPQEPLWTFTALRLIETDGEYSRFPETYETYIQNVPVPVRVVNGGEVRVYPGFVQSGRYMTTFDPPAG